MRALFTLLALAYTSSQIDAAPEDAGNGGFVTYEQFGAIGDGVADDLPAIRDAHAFANEKGLPVRSKFDGIYHLGGQDITVIIATDTDWSTSRFFIDDRDVENHRQAIFKVSSLLEPKILKIDTLVRDQEKIDGTFEHDYYVFVQKNDKKVYIRKGLNAHPGFEQRDCFILKKDGTITSPIDWNYDHIDEAEGWPIEENTLTLKGGVFTTYANNRYKEKGYDYWGRNIVISRSNTVVDGLTHYVTGETSIGRPYRGFLSASKCADVTFKNCFASGRKKYWTIGAAGKPVEMGSYDYSVNSVVNFKMINCRMNGILDRTLWGVIASNFCKNILLEDCELSRMDAHMGVSGTYTIRRTKLGYRGLNAIGRGKIVIEDSTLYGPALINFRKDYGSTWEGTVEIRDSKWIPIKRKPDLDFAIFQQSNDGSHDFGYPTFMPETIVIDGLEIDDSHNEGQLYFFSDPEITGEADVPYPHHLTKKLHVRNISVASGQSIELSPNSVLTENVEFINADSE